MKDLWIDALSDGVDSLMGGSQLGTGLPQTIADCDDGIGLAEHASNAGIPDWVSWQQQHIRTTHDHRARHTEILAGSQSTLAIGMSPVAEYRIGFPVAAECLDRRLH